eukprot:3574888-Alexandrium_andersonii.AAC.1
MAGRVERACRSSEAPSPAGTGAGSGTGRSSAEARRRPGVGRDHSSKQSSKGLSSSARRATPCEVSQD